MIKQVSWADYLLVLTVVLVTYYFIVILLFYRDEIRQLMTGKRKLFAKGQDMGSESSQ